MELEWQANVPISKKFGDIYYSVEDGLAESRYVFLDGNQLMYRWKEKQESNQNFYICELGFGSGLNFCMSCQAFLEQASSEKKLHYIACEKYPLSTEQMAKALSVFLEIKPYAQEFICDYPFLIKQNMINKIELDQTNNFPKLLLHKGRICLYLYFADVSVFFTKMEALCHKQDFKVDAWFLDGFSPQKNPAMWTKEVFSGMKMFSKESSSLATFSVAGQVRRGLQEAGFCVERIHGFGKKHQMLRGRKQN